MNSKKHFVTLPLAYEYEGTRVHIPIDHVLIVKPFTEQNSGRINPHRCTVLDATIDKSYHISLSETNCSIEIQFPR